MKNTLFIGLCLVAIVFASCNNKSDKATTAPVATKSATTVTDSVKQYPLDGDKFKKLSNYIKTRGGHTMLVYPCGGNTFYFQNNGSCCVDVWANNRQQDTLPSFQYAVNPTYIVARPCDSAVAFRAVDSMLCIAATAKCNHVAN